MTDVGAVYPFQGSELLMVILGVVFWIGWSRIQYVREAQHLKEAEQMGDKEKIAKVLERY